MQQAVEMVRGDVGTIRTGRATPSLVEDVVIDAYGGQQQLRVVELATISAPEPRTIIVAPWDQNIIGEIKQGIEKAKSGLTPVIAGEVIRVNLPLMTSEDRDNYIKMLHQKLENGRISVRQVRQDGMHKIKREVEEEGLSEDNKILKEKKLQEITDEHIGQIDEIGKSKETELGTV